MQLTAQNLVFMAPQASHKLQAVGCIRDLSLHLLLRLQLLEAHAELVDFSTTHEEVAQLVTAMLTRVHVSAEASVDKKKRKLMGCCGHDALRLLQMLLWTSPMQSWWTSWCVRRWRGM